MSLVSLDRHARALLDRVESMEIPRSLEDRFSRYREDPVGFVTQQLGAAPEEYQRAILAAAVTEPRIVWRAGHGTGKTTVLAWLLLWWLLTRPFSRVLLLAPAYERQISRYLIPEAEKWARGAPERLPLTFRANAVEVEGYERSWYALGVQASDSTRTEGGHATSLAVLCDEAKGLSADVIAAMHGSQTDIGGDRLFVLASVPGAASGAFADAFRKGSWRRFHTSARASRLVARSWLEERAAEWGAGSPLYQARVEGNFPDEDAGVLFRLSDLEAAVERKLVRAPDAQLPAPTFGVDVATGEGPDLSALAVWRGPELLKVETFQGLDVLELASWVASEANRQKPRLICVDRIGVGDGTYRKLKQLGHRVEGVHVGTKSSDPDVFLNLRSEIFWRLREGLERGEVSLPPDDKLLAELSALRWETTSKGQIKLELKAETRRRVGHSPDRADAVALGYHRAVVRRPAKREVRVRVDTYSAPTEEKAPRGGPPHEVTRFDEMGRTPVRRRRYTVDL